MRGFLLGQGLKVLVIHGQGLIGLHVIIIVELMEDFVLVSYVNGEELLILGVIHCVQYVLFCLLLESGGEFFGVLLEGFTKLEIIGWRSVGLLFFSDL